MGSLGRIYKSELGFLFQSETGIRQKVGSTLKVKVIFHSPPIDVSTNYDIYIDVCRVLLREMICFLRI